MRTWNLTPRRSVLALIVWLSMGLSGHVTAADPVAIRVENLTVPPSTGPLVSVQVKNLLEQPYQAAVSIQGPSGWQIAPERRGVALAPGETRRVAFAIEKGRNLAANSYPFEVSADGAGTTVLRKQSVACASAPYYKPEIDGDPSEWKDAIPITFLISGKKTVISTYWNRRQFSMLVAVEEDRLSPYGQQPPPAGFDAVQIAISPEDSATGSSQDQKAARFEFLLVATGVANGGRCFQLASPETTLAEVARARDLAPLQYADAAVAVTREEGITYYECSIPFRSMREQIRPTEGREFFLSALVHDPDGTGIRDLGEALGLWPWQRSALAWSRWKGAAWNEKPPLDNKLRWGLCTSKY
ncbi:MAG: hypothetical protein JXB62_17700 [Pirellulales bacterium]|nr:hypothetical protein [Pirellulales bacterium]